MKRYEVYHHADCERVGKTGEFHFLRHGQHGYVLQCCGMPLEVHLVQIEVASLDRLTHRDIAVRYDHVIAPEE